MPKSILPVVMGRTTWRCEPQVFEVGIAVVLTCLVIAIGGMNGRELLGQFHDVAVQARFLGPR
jgi:hypothetical protein